MYLKISNNKICDDFPHGFFGSVLTHEAVVNGDIIVICDNEGNYWRK